MQTRNIKNASGWLEKYRALWEGNYRRLDALLDELKAVGDGARAGDSPAP